MALKTQEEYLESLRDGRVVYFEGKRVDDVTTHPVIRVCAEGMTDYILANDPRYRDLFTEVTDDGDIVPFVYFAPRSSEDLIRRRKIIQTASRTSFGIPLASKFTGVDGLNAVTLVCRRIDSQFGTNYSERVENYRRFALKTDPAMAVCVTDVKGDRSLRPSKQQPHQDYYLHVVERRSDGIVVRGAKTHISLAPCCNEMIVIPTRRIKAEEKDYAVAFAVPADTRGISYIYGRQPSDTRRLEQGRSDVGNLFYGGCEAMVVFDDVFVPKERIFMKGEYPMAGPLIELFAAHHRASYGGCKVGVGDVLIGATAAIAEAQGTSRASHVKDKIAEMVHLNETLHAGALASAGKGYQTASGAYAVDALMANVCKLNVTRFPFEISRLAQDIAGGLLVTMPSLVDRENPEVGKYIDKYLGGKSDVDSDKRMRILRLIENITLGTGAVSYLTESIHGAGSPQAQKIMIARLADLESAKLYAFKLCGL